MFGTSLTTSSKHHTATSMTRDINALAAYSAQCRNLSINVWKSNVSHTSSEIGLRQSRKFVWEGVLQSTNIHKGNPYRKDIWTPLYKRAIQRGESVGGFSDSPTSGGVDVGQYTEDEIAEAIFDWWISGKPYKQWYAEKYLQQKINFEEDENQ